MMEKATSLAVGKASLARLKTNFVEVSRISDHSHAVAPALSTPSDYPVTMPNLTVGSVDVTSADCFLNPILSSEPVGVDKELIRETRICDSYGYVPAVYDPTPSTPFGDSSQSLSILTAYDSWKKRFTGKCLQEFLTEAIPKNLGVVQCSVTRTRGVLGTTYFPKYNFGSDPLQGTGLVTTFMTSRKEAGANSVYPVYGIGISQSEQIGTLSANFMGSEYMISTLRVGSDVKLESGAIKYSSGSNSTNARGPREIRIILPARASLRKPTGQVGDATILDIPSMHVFENKRPRWEQRIGGYVVNFNHRVVMPSVKNFQLVDIDSHSTVLQFGKVSEDVFTLDFSHHFSPFQAFATALSSFDFKFCCD